MKKLFTLLFSIMCAGIAMSQTPSVTVSKPILSHPAHNVETYDVKVSVKNAKGHTVIPYLFYQYSNGNYLLNKSGKTAYYQGPTYYNLSSNNATLNSCQFKRITTDNNVDWPKGSTEAYVVVRIYDVTQKKWLPGKSGKLGIYNINMDNPVNANAGQGMTPGSSGLLIDNTYLITPDGRKIDSYSPEVTGAIYLESQGKGRSGSTTGSKRRSSASGSCRRCGGSGDCPTCHGTGKANVRMYGKTTKSTCGTCKGGRRCPSCGGRGRR